MSKPLTPRHRRQLGLAILYLVIVLWGRAPVHAQPTGESKGAPNAAHSSEVRGLAQ